jgi:hypothetical protein
VRPDDCDQPLAGTEVVNHFLRKHPASAGHVLHVHPRIVAMSPKVSVEVLDEALIVLPGMGEEQFVVLAAV